MSFRSNVISVQRSYDPTNQRLSSITRGGYIPGVTGKQNQTYGFSYDAWGKPLTAQSYNSSFPYLHAINPLRYRGYYYDTETGWYYLQSRYYDPILKRFLNADNYASTGQGFLGYNMFAYCGNNPVNAYDPSGCRSIIEQDLGGGVTGYTDAGTGRPSNVSVFSNSEDDWMTTSQTMGNAFSNAAGSANAKVYPVTNDTFLSLWQTQATYYLIIHTHGASSSLVGESLSFSVSDMEALPQNLKIKYIVITACSTGGDNGDAFNVGQMLSTRIAPDGLVICCSETVSGYDRQFYSKYGGPWYIYQNGRLLRSPDSTSFTMEQFFGLLAN